MSEPRKRRPLPALICLLALVLLTTIVWWRVVHREDATRANAAASTQATCSVGKTVLPNPATVTVSVLNATQRAGLARATAQTLQQRGFKVSSFGNDTPTARVTGVAEIRYTADQKLAAQLLSYYFPTAKQVALGTASTGKLTVSLGTTFSKIAATATVNAAVAGAHATVAPATAPPSPTGSPSC
jgi:regulation of enolase protein 1 (concanavalin A-like superfamily)